MPYADLVSQTTSSTGTGNLTLDAVNGKRTFLAAFGTGGTNVFDYFISHRNAAEWERGMGHESGGALVRDTISASSNAGAPVSFTAGIKDVTHDQPANERAALDEANVWSAPQGYAEVALTYSSGGTTAWDVSVAPMAVVAIGSGNTTMGAPSGVLAGRVYSIRFTQDTTPRTVAWPASYKWIGGQAYAPVISTGSGAADRFTFIGRAGNVLEEVGRAQDIG